jgi:hypothetical protein
MPWSILIVVAPETLQLRSADPPGEMLDGWALKETIEGCWPEVVIIIGPPGAQPAINNGTSKSKGTSFFISNLLK